MCICLHRCHPAYWFAHSSVWFFFLCFTWFEFSTRSRASGSRKYNHACRLSNSIVMTSAHWQWKCWAVPLVDSASVRARAAGVGDRKIYLFVRFECWTWRRRPYLHCFIVIYGLDLGQVSIFIMNRCTNKHLMHAISLANGSHVHHRNDDFQTDSVSTKCALGQCNFVLWMKYIMIRA